jgi:hypothetical protein
MKKIILSFILAVVTIFTATAQQIKVEVSETVELMSILARTAGYEEYSNDLAGQYTKDTEAWFAPYKEHTAVALARDVRAKYGIGHERVMNMAVHLDIDNGKIVLIGDRAPLDLRSLGSGQELSNGWQNVDLDDFLKRLNKFYKDTRFHEFFVQHRTFYDDYTKMYEANVMPTFRPEWFSQFHYGTAPADRFHVIINFTCGGNSYGPWRQLSGRPRDLFAIIGYWIDPALGRPRYDASVLYHEVNHPFVNPLLDDPNNIKLMENVGPRLLSIHQSSVERTNYTDWRIVINESLVRAAVVLYMQDAGYKMEQYLNVMGLEMVQKGFPWMFDLVGTLRYYTAHRDKYPTLADFYPDIARCLEKYVEDEDKRMPFK